MLTGTDMIKILNEYSNLLVAISTIVLAIITAFYVVYTKRMLKEMIKAREDDKRPYLVVDVFATDRVFHLAVQNIGKTSAQNVLFTFDKTVEVRWKKLNDLPLFKDELDEFLPDKEFVFMLGADHLFLSDAKDETKYPSVFTISVAYTYFDGSRKDRQNFKINLEKYRHTKQRPNELVKMQSELGEKITKTMESLAASLEKLSKVEAITSPSGLDISHGSLYKLSTLLGSKHKVKFNLNLVTVSELMEIFYIKTDLGEKIIEQREVKGLFESYDDLKTIEGMTDDIIEAIKEQTFISNPYF